jgi:hypothetical protein
MIKTGHIKKLEERLKVCEERIVLLEKFCQYVLHKGGRHE